MSRRRYRKNIGGVPFWVGVLGAVGVGWLLLEHMGTSSTTTAQLNADLETDPYASLAPGTVFPGGSVVLQ